MKTKINVYENNGEYFPHIRNTTCVLLDDNDDLCSGRSFPEEPGEKKQVMFYSLIRYS